EFTGLPSGNFFMMASAIYLASFVYLASDIYLASFAAIAGFTVIALRHPYGFNALRIGEPDEIANSAICGLELLLDFGQTEGKTLLSQALTQFLRQSSELGQRPEAL